MNFRAVLICLSLGCAVPAAAQRDSVAFQSENEEWREKVRTERAGTVEGKESINALDHRLQRTRVAKHFERKRFLDHLFVEVAGNGNFTLMSDGKAGGGLRLQLGDFVTPQHGWRLGVQVNRLALDSRTTTSVGFAADYLLNLTATASHVYQPARRWEWYGIAGFDVLAAYENSEHETAYGAHVGLRAQWNASQMAYFFIEPQAGLLLDKAWLTYHWRRYRPVASVNVGIGYALNRAQRGDNSLWPTSGHWLDNTFLSVAGGADMLWENNSGGNRWDNFRGARMALSIGKFFTPVHGLRLTAQSLTIRQQGARRVRGFEGRADYVTNLHNVFGGYRPERKFWVNSLLGVGLDFTSSAAPKRATVEAGIGLQGNVRLSRDVSLFIEPRVDLHQDRFAVPTNSFSSVDATTSLLAGLTFFQGGQTAQRRAQNQNFRRHHAFSHLFFEAQVGAAMPVHTSTLHHPDDYVQPRFALAAGMWLSPTSGLRVFSDLGRIKESGEHETMRAAALGVDYLWNASNTFRGYNPARKFELWTSLGVNVAARSKSGSRLYPGFQCGVRGIAYPTPMVGLYVESSFRFYGTHFNPFTTLGGQTDILATLMAGVQIRMHDYMRQAEREIYRANEPADFVSVAGGTWNKAASLQHPSTYGALARISYTHRFAPAQAWRFAAGGQEHKATDGRYVRATAGLDYLVDLSTLAYGYQSERPWTLWAFAGADLGASDRSGGHTARFSPDVHAGARLQWRFVPKWGVHLESQVAYVGDKKIERRSNRVMPALYVGLDHYLTRSGRLRDVPKERPERHRFASLSLGAGAHTATFNAVPEKREKVIGALQLSYGGWWRAAQGWRVSVQWMDIPRHSTPNEHNCLAWADYLLSLSGLLRGATLDDAPFTLAAFAGAGVGVAASEGYTPHYGASARCGLLGAVSLSKSLALTIEPTAAMHSKRLFHESQHRGEFTAQVLLGLQYRF